MSPAATATMPLTFKNSPHERVHGPRGYKDYSHYKDWLRDEFVFRCVYCLIRERWFPDGHRSFTVEHLTPKSEDLSRICDYENLLYSCSRCNSLKGAAAPLIDPCKEALGDHLSFEDDGRVVAVTRLGEGLISLFLLDAEDMIDFRRRVLRLFKTLQDRAELSEDLSAWFGFPDDLPDLALKRPPGGNDRPSGVEQCHFERRLRGELPDIY